MNNNEIKCPYCKTEATIMRYSHHHHTCECSRLHKKVDFNNQLYYMLYHKNGTKEMIMPNKDTCCDTCTYNNNAEWNEINCPINKLNHCKIEESYNE